MKTITLFGASGRTGKEILSLGLEKGYAVNAFCRDRKKILVNNENLNIIEGNILDQKDVYNAVKGADFVVCAIGTLPPHKDIYCYEAMKNIIYAMYEFKLRRLICITGAMIGDFTPNQSRFMKFMTNRFNKSKPLAALDRLKQEMAVKASKLDWTLVKPPRLTSGPLTEYKAAEEMKITAFSSVSRKTVASFIMKVLNDRETFQRALYLK